MSKDIKVNDIKNFEKKLEKLELILEKMESSNTSLDDSVTLFSDGMKLIAECKKNLTDVEKLIAIASVDEDSKVKLEKYEKDDDNIPPF